MSDYERYIVTWVKTWDSDGFDHVFEEQIFTNRQRAVSFLKRKDATARMEKEYYDQNPYTGMYEWDKREDELPVFYDHTTETLYE